MANTFLTPDAIAMEALVLLQSNLVATRLFSRRYEPELATGMKRGDTIRIRRRGKGTVDEYTGSSVTARPITESSISLQLEKHFDATVEVTDRDRSLSIVDFSEQILAPNLVEMGERIDSYALTKLLDIPNVAATAEAGTLLGAGALPNSVEDLAQVEKGMNDLKIPLMPRYMIASTEYKATLLSVPTFVEVDKSGADSALRMAEIGPLMGLRTFMAQNVPTATFTSGTAESMVVNGAVAPGATTIAMDGANGATVTLVAGDILQIAGYGGVVVAANVTFSGSAANVTIKEPVRETIADNAAVTVYDNIAASAGAETRQCHGAVFHPDCLALVTVPLDLPSGAPAGYVRDNSTGLSLRVVFDYDRNLKADIMSIDILVGAKMVDGRLGLQIVKNI